MKKPRTINCSKLEKKLIRQLIEFVELDVDFESSVQLKAEINTTTNLLYDESHKQKYYWSYCSLETYLHVVDSLREEFECKFVDSNEQDFWIHERQILDALYDHSFQQYAFQGHPFLIRLGDDQYKKLFYTLNRKLEFIDQQIEDTKPFEKMTKEVLMVNSSEELSSVHSKNSFFKIGNLKFDLAQRYYIVNEILGLGKLLSKLDAPQADKHQLLAMLLNCHKDNAKKIFNGSYDPLIRLNKKRVEIEYLNDFINKYKST